MAAAIASRDPAPLVGRDRELASLRGWLANVIAGRGTAVLLGGEAGIGKTALAEAFLDEAAERGALALVGRCYDLGETPPYGPWIELCGQLAGGTALPVPLGAGGAAESQAALFAQVQRALAGATTRGPLVLLLEDLHWADAASLDLLRVVGRHLDALPLLLVATYRDDELVDRSPLAATLPALVREARAGRLTLPRLTDEQTRALLRSRFRLAAEDEARLAAHLQTQAEGNPLYLGELLRALEEEGLLRPASDGERWLLGDLAGARVPPLLRQVIGARVARLGDEAGALLAMAAVIGQEVALDLWSGATAVSDDTLAGVVGPAVAARLLKETPDGAAVRFAHALVREALYEAIPLPARRALHRRAADVLLATPNPDPDAVAHHLLRAGDRRAPEWLIKAGDRARHAYAWVTAAERYEAALRLLEYGSVGDAQRGWLLSRLAGLYRYSDTSRALAYLEKAESLGRASSNRGLIANAQIDHGLYRCFLGDFPRGLAEMEAGVEAMEARSPAEMAHAAAMMEYTPGMERGALALWLAFAGHYDRAQRMGEETAARRLTLPENESAGESAFGDTHFSLLCAYAALGQPGNARQSYVLALAAYEATQHHNLIALTTLWMLCTVELRYATDDLTTRRRLTDAAEQSWRRTSGGALAPFPAAIARLPLLLLEGRWAEARALEPRRFGVWFIDWFVAPLQASLARAQGDTTTAWQVINDWLPDGPRTPPGRSFDHAGEALVALAATLALDAGDLPLAHAWLAAHDRWLAWSGAVPGRTRGQLNWATYHRATGDPAAAQAAAERALARASEPRQPIALLAAHRLLGELDAAEGRHAEATAHLAAALALADACAAPYERALTLLALAELRLAEGRREAAQAALGEGHAILARLGARPALARCDALAARLPGRLGTPATPAPPAAPYPARLTAREVEVLRLIAAGKSNREMAEALCRSERTIERHIENIYHKIDAHSKAEATAFAFRHRLA